MSTRGIIAFAKDSRHPELWEGRYHHSDSYPIDLGAYLFAAFRGYFKYDFVAMRQYLFEAHPAGYSTIVGADLSLPCGYSYDYAVGYEKDANGNSDFSKPTPQGARCFCHGARSEEENTYTQSDDAGVSDAEWLYVLTNVEYTIELRVSRPIATGGTNSDEDAAYRWEEVARIDLFEKDPDWGKVQCGDNLERCTHIAVHHFPELSGTSMKCLSTRTFLGRCELNERDAYAFKIAGHRYIPTGSSSSGNDKRGTDVWVASVKPENSLKYQDHLIPRGLKDYSLHWGGGFKVYDGGTTFDIIVSRRDRKTGKQVPYKGVMYLYPPTIKEPIRLFAELRDKLLRQVEGGQGTEELSTRSGLALMLSTGRLFRDEERLTAN